MDWLERVVSMTGGAVPGELMCKVTRGDTREHEKLKLICCQLSARAGLGFKLRFPLSVKHLMILLLPMKNRVIGNGGFGYVFLMLDDKYTNFVT